MHLPLLFLQLQCINGITLLTRRPPSLPSLSLFLLSLSLPSQSIHSPIFFFLPLSKMPPDPYLSILSPSQFSAPFLLFLACRSSRCHQVFCRRRETRRKPAQSGGQPTTCGTQNALVMVTSRLRFRIDELFFFFAETYLSVTPGDGAQTCDRCRERSRRHSTH